MEFEKGHFHRKIIEFCFSYPHFFLISEYILQNLFFVTCANNDNLGKLHMQIKRKWSTWKNNLVSWKNLEKSRNFFPVLSGNPGV